MNKPLTIQLQEAKDYISNEINVAMKKFGIPSFIMDMVLSDIQIQISKQAKSELLIDVKTFLNDIQGDSEKGEKDDI